MTFSSLTFLYFFVIVTVLMAVTKLSFIKKAYSEEKLASYRKMVLVVANYIFYGWWDVRFCFLMLFLTYISYICSLGLEKNRKLYLSIGVIIPLLVLGIFKYFNFFTDSFAAVFGIKNMMSLKIILPVGISFYTFQSMSYTLDVSRGRLPAERSFIDVAMYISFFPQLVAGPIVKAEDFLPQLKENRNVSWNGLHNGVQIFAFGMFKKLVIADNLSVFVDHVFANPNMYSGFSLVLGVISYSIQIYCDFSGYSDMATGAAKCLGYDLKQNFNLPYLSKNISEFWKRWHISLSEWLMEYLYIPLGGNRKGKARTYINLMITMVLGGLWHGAAWTFVVWGVLHGAALCLQKLFSTAVGHGKNYKGTVAGNIVSAVFTYAFVCFCWIFFRADSFGTAYEVIKGIFTWQSGTLHIYSYSIFAIITVAICSVSAMIKSKKYGNVTVQGYYPNFNLTTVRGLTVFFVFCGIIAALAYTGSNPFIYFQF